MNIFMIVFGYEIMCYSIKYLLWLSLNIKLYILVFKEKLMYQNSYKGLNYGI